MNTINATLIKRDTTSGVGSVYNRIPLGKTYKVIPESISKISFADDKTEKIIEVECILASNDDGSFGFLPLELLKLEEN